MGNALTMLGLLFATLVVVCSATLAAAASGPSLKVVVVYPDQNGASQLTLRGDGCGLSWESDTALAKAAANTWSAVLSCNASGITLSFKTRADGTWQVGANEQVVTSDGCVTVYPWYGNQVGQYEIMGDLHSEALGNSRTVIVYTPPSYKENTLKPYTDVIVMHDGQNLFNDSTSFLGIAWNIQTTMDEQIVEGGMREVVVVGLYNTPARNDEYTYSYDAQLGFGGKGKVYVDWIISDVLPWSSAHLRVRPERWGIMGSSLGGLISCYAGWTRPSIFGLTGCMSSSFWWNSMDFNSSILVNNPPPPLPKMFYIDTGTDEGSDPALQVQQTKVVAAHVAALGPEVATYYQEGGQHNEYYWGKRFPHVITTTYPPVPHKVTQSCLRL